MALIVKWLILFDNNIRALICKAKPEASRHLNFLINRPMASAPDTKYPSDKLTLLQFCGCLASILAVIVTPALLPKDIVSAVYAFFVGILLFLSLGYIYLIHRRKLHRYAQASNHWHFANHVVRDDLYVLENKLRKNELSISELKDHAKNTTVEILQTISQCFSIVTSAHCSSCVKEIISEAGALHVKTAERDPISRKTRSHYDREKPNHKLEDNTDFRKVFFCRPGYERNFLCNDLKGRWEIGDYHNTSFEMEGKTPRRSTFLKMAFVKNWKLPYRSAFVVPIRFMAEKCDPPKRGTASKVEDGKWCYYGFLCIDSNSINIFDEKRCSELGGAFADILFIYFWQIDRMLDALSSKDKMLTALKIEQTTRLEVESRYNKLESEAKKLLLYVKKKGDGYLTQ